MKRVKTYIITVALWAANVSLLAQIDVATGFADNAQDMGWWLQLSGYVHPQHEVGIGATYNFNYRKEDTRNYTYFRRMFGVTPIQRWSFNVGYNYYFLPKYSNFQLFTFYDFQFTYSSLHNVVFYKAKNYNTFGRPVYVGYAHFHGPFYWLSHNAGIGIKVKLLGRFYLIQKVGLGLMMIVGDDKIGKEANAFILKKNVACNFSHIIETGLLFRFGLGRQ
jgi:hypothetical protein